MIRIFTQAIKIISIVLLTLAVAGGSVWFFDYWTHRTESDLVGRPVTITIDKDDDAGGVSKKLADAKMIRYGVYFETRMKMDGGELRPGTYNLRIGMSVPEIIKVITVPDSGETEQKGSQKVADQPAFKVTFIEGRRLEENGKIVQEAGLKDGQAKYIEAARDIERFRDKYWFLADVPKGASLEGFLFPSTYNIGEGATAEDVINYQLTAFEQQFTPEMKSTLESRKTPIFEAVTIASIVEREAALPVERPTIAQVYFNRLDQNWMLNADPAQQYGIGTEADWWPQMNTELLNKSYGTKYDTYQHTGLPPGPIANPGFASLQASVQPDGSDYMFFVTKGDDSGAHVFTRTQQEHDAATCQEHPDYEQCQGGSITLPNASIDVRRVA